MTGFSIVSYTALHLNSTVCSFVTAVYMMLVQWTGYCSEQTRQMVDGSTEDCCFISVALHTLTPSVQSHPVREYTGCRKTQPRQLTLSPHALGGIPEAVFVVGPNDEPRKGGFAT
jgi:hypothetical protein